MSRAMPEVDRLAVLLLGLWLVLAGFGAASASPRRVALVIGNSAYQHAPTLENPVRDARAIHEKLASLGFEVVAGYDLTKAETQAAIAKFAEAARGGDIALFFYAGHGMQVGGVNYLVPVDAALKDEISLDFEAVQMDFIWRQMSRATKVRIVFLDACRDNPLARILAAGGSAAQPGGGLAEMQIENTGAGGALIAFSTSPGHVAYDGANGHSPFTTALLAHLADPDLPLTSVMTRVTGDVLKTTSGQQRPWVNVSLTDDVMLNRAAPPLVTPPLAAATPPADQEAIAQLRRMIPTLPAAGTIRFDTPIQFGDPAIDGKSIAQLVATGHPLFAPVEGLPKPEWDQPCSACHNWTKERVCAQSTRYDREDVSVMRLPHPLGFRFKVALGRWAKDGCK
jgi:uncharacterized caspase-like protein